MKPFTKLLLFLGLAALEFQDEKTSLSKQQVDKLQKNFKDHLNRDLNFENIEFDADGYAQISYEALEKVNDAIPDDYDPAKFAVANAAQSAAGSQSKDDDPVIALNKKLEEQDRRHKAEIEEIRNAMASNPATDPLVVGTRQSHPVVKQSLSARKRVVVAGHLFGENSSYLKVDSSRPWNMAAEQMLMGESPGEFLTSSIDITQINSDFGAFIRGRKGDIIRWFAPNDEFNRIFPVIDGVDEGDMFMSLDLSQITQAYQKGWTPQGKARFTARKPTLFDIKIDLEFEDLKSIENTWLSEFNNEGSAAYKMSFVEFLLFSIASKAVLEDQIALINGKFSAPVAGVAGNFINKLDGLREQLYQLQEARLAKPFNIGQWNTGATIAFVKAMVNAIPEEQRSRPNLGFYASNEFIEAYWYERRTSDNQVLDYDPAKSTILGHPNIRLIPLPYAGNSKRCIITPVGNIRQLFGYKDKEYPKFEVEKSKRVFNIFTDYKKAIHISVAGLKAASAQEFLERGYEYQLIWFNNADLANDIPMNAVQDQTILNVTRHKYVKTVANTVATAITDIAGAITGDEIKIECGSLDNASTIANAGKFSLASAWIPTSIGQYIIMYKRSDGKFVELSRFNPSAEPVAVAFTADDVTPSVADGTVFKTSSGNTAARTITNLDDAVEDVDYKIYGDDDAHATTIPNSGNFVLSAAWTGAAEAFIILRKKGTKFYEISRNA